MVNGVRSVVVRSPGGVRRASGPSPCSSGRMPHVGWCFRFPPSCVVWVLRWSDSDLVQLTGARGCAGVPAVSQRALHRRAQWHGPAWVSHPRPALRGDSLVQHRQSQHLASIHALRGGGSCVWCPTPTSNPTRRFNPRSRTGRPLRCDPRRRRRSADRPCRHAPRSRRTPSPPAARGRLACVDRRSPRRRRVARSPARTPETGSSSRSRRATPIGARGPSPTTTRVGTSSNPSGWRCAGSLARATRLATPAAAPDLWHSLACSSIHQRVIAPGEVW